MVVFDENVFIRIKRISFRNIFPVYVVFHGWIISNILLIMKISRGLLSPTRFCYTTLWCFLLLWFYLRHGYVLLWRFQEAAASTSTRMKAQMNKCQELRWLALIVSLPYFCRFIKCGHLKCGLFLKLILKYGGDIWGEIYATLICLFEINWFLFFVIFFVFHLLNHSKTVEKQT